MTESSTEESPLFARRRWVLFLLVGSIFFAGLLPRLSQYASTRALWLDEAQLCANLLDRSYAGLFLPLDYNQIAPPFYLLSQKTAIGLMGVNVFAVRLPSIVGGILALLLFWPLARRALGERAALWGLLFLALSQHLIYYSGEAKPYSSDAFWTVLLLLLLIRIEQKPNARWPLVALTVAAILAVWYSYPSVFLLAGAGAPVIAVLWRRQQRRYAILLLGGLTLSALSFLVHYFFVMRAVREDASGVGYMDFYWRHGFMPLPPRSWFECTWFKERAFMFLDMPGGFTLPGLAFFVATAGAVHLCLRSPVRSLMFLLPFAVTLFASGLKLYPFHARMTLFLAPVLFLVMGEGMATLTNGSLRSGVILGVVAASLLLAQPAVRAIRVVREPASHHELGRVLQHARLNWREGDVLLLGFPDTLSYPFLQERLEFPQDAVLQAGVFGEELQVAPLLGRIAGAKRVWYAAAYDQKESVQPVAGQLQRKFPLIEAFDAPGASVWCFQCEKSLQ